MTLGFKLVLLIAPLVLATGALAQTSFPNAEKGKGQDEMVCKRFNPTGSRFHQRKCLTRAQWDIVSEEHKRMWTEIRDRPQVEIRR